MVDFPEVFVIVFIGTDNDAGMKKHAINQGSFVHRVKITKLSGFPVPDKGIFVVLVLSIVVTEGYHACNIALISLLGGFINGYK